MQDQHELEQLIRGAILSGAIVTLLMAVVGALLFQRQLERRIGTIRETAARIERGDLAQRVPISARQDEFARLSHDINAMLAALETAPGYRPAQKLLLQLQEPSPKTN